MVMLNKSKLEKKEFVKKIIIIVLAILIAIETICFTIYFIKFIEKNNRLKEFNDYKNKVKFYEILKDNLGIQKLYEINEDFIGWIKCDDIGLSLPVVASNDEKDKEYYLTHDFENKESIFGCPYLKYGCSLDSSNNSTVIGHSSFLTGEVIFSEFINYLDSTNNKNYNYMITIETNNGLLSYEIFSAFQIYTKDDISDAYFIYNTADFNVGDFETFYSNCKKLSVIERNIPVDVEDKFLTIITCSKINLAYRVVVVAKLN